MANAPGGVILEPNERVILATRPLFLWEPLVVLEVVLVVASLYLFGQSGVGTTRDNPSVQLAWLSYAVLAFAALLLLWSLLRWIPWSRKWFVLTDRRGVATWGGLNRKQAALLLDRRQDGSLSPPVPQSPIPDYGVIHLQSTGEHAQASISRGPDRAA